MKLYYHCNYCETSFALPYAASDRQQLASLTGEQLKARCDNCGAFHDVHVNEIVARPRRKRHFLTLIGTAAMAPVLFWFWQFYWQPSTIATQSLLPASGIVILIGDALFLIWRYQESRAVSTFNHRRFSRRPMQKSR